MKPTRIKTEKIEELSIPTFISSVENRKPLWSRSHQSKPGIRKFQQNLWNELGRIHNLSGEHLKLKWKNLKIAFDRRLNKIPRGEDNKFLPNLAEYNSNWPYFKLMLFLVDPKDVRAEVFAPKKRKSIQDEIVTKKRHLSESIPLAESNEINDGASTSKASKPLDLSMASIPNSPNLRNGRQENNDDVVLDLSVKSSTEHTGNTENNSQTIDEVEENTPDVAPITNFGDFHFLMSLQEFFTGLDPSQNITARTTIYAYLRGLIADQNN